MSTGSASAVTAASTASLAGWPPPARARTHHARQANSFIGSAADRRPCPASTAPPSWSCSGAEMTVSTSGQGHLGQIDDTPSA